VACQNGVVDAKSSVTFFLMRSRVVLYARSTLSDEEDKGEGTDLGELGERLALERVVLLDGLERARVPCAHDALPQLHLVVFATVTCV